MGLTLLFVFLKELQALMSGHVLGAHVILRSIVASELHLYHVLQLLVQLSDSNQSDLFVLTRSLQSVRDVC